MDVLMTYKGIALYIPPIKEQLDPVGLQYLPWNKVVFTSRGKMMIKSVFNCELHQEPIFESLDGFKQRYDTFHGDIRNLRHQYTKECLEKARSHAQLKQDEIALQCVEEGLKSNVYRPKFNLMYDLMAIKNSILKKQKIKAQKIVTGVEDLLINYLKTNEGKAFTSKSLISRLEDTIDNPDAHEYFKTNLEGLLNNLTFKRIILSTQKEGDTYYFFEKKAILEKKIMDESYGVVEPIEKAETPQVKMKYSPSAKPEASTITMKEEEKMPVEKIIQKALSQIKHLEFPDVQTQSTKQLPKQQIKAPTSTTTPKVKKGLIPDKREPPKPKIIKCPFCGIEINEEITFCAQCGMVLKKK